MEALCKTKTKQKEENIKSPDKSFQQTASSDSFTIIFPVDPLWSTPRKQWVSTYQNTFKSTKGEFQNLSAASNLKKKKMTTFYFGNKFVVTMGLSGLISLVLLIKEGGKKVTYQDLSISSN